MVIQTQINDGNKTDTRIYRGVLRGRDYAKFIDGFYAQGMYNKWGLMTELRGINRIRLASFGAIEPRARHIGVYHIPQYDLIEVRS